MSDLNTLFSNYENSMKDLCSFFDIEFEENELICFKDFTDSYWVQFEEENEIMWAERRETIENEDCEGSAYISHGPYYDKKKLFALYMIQEDCEIYFAIFDRLKKVSL